MAIWNTLKRELDRAGQAAQGALDEGRLRLESHRAKQRAESAAASLGYAVYRARAAGGDLQPGRYAAPAAHPASAGAGGGRPEAGVAAPAAKGSTALTHAPPR